MAPELSQSKPATKTRNAIDDLRFLDTLLKMGEEPYEISSEVTSISDKCALEYFVWLSSRGIQFPVEGLKLLISALFEFTYVEYWSRRAAIRKLTKAKIAEFYAPLSGADYETRSDLLTPADLLILFFRYLAEGGYDVNAESLAKEIGKQRAKVMNGAQRS